MNLRSVASGFLECDNDSQPLSSLILNTAEKEADEEFVLAANNQRRFEFVGSPAIASVSLRAALGAGMVPTIEFVVPLQLNHDADYVLDVMNHNQAPHAHEHVAGSAVNVPVDAEARRTAAQFIHSRYPGSFLYAPVLHACAVKANPGHSIAHRVDEIPESRFYPISIFPPKITKALKDNSAEEVVQQLKKHFKA